MHFLEKKFIRIILPIFCQRFSALIMIIFAYICTLNTYIVRFRNRPQGDTVLVGC